MKTDESLNVYGKPLRTCCMSPVTGFFRNGCCDTSDQDVGVHTVCIIVTDSFLAFSKEAGNDLSTPIPEYGFSGLKKGDKWCLCAARWLEAYHAGVAPHVVISATHQKTLEIVDLELLESFAIDNK
jgi:uncharacterized protein